MSVEFVPEQVTPPASGESAAPAAREPIPVIGRPRRLWLRSLTSKLVAGVVVLVLVLVTASGVSTYYALKYVLYNRLDQQVAATAKPDSILNLLNTSQRFGGGLSLPQTVSVAVVVSSTGVLTAVQPTGPDLNRLSLSASALRKLAGESVGPTSLTTTDHRRLRVMSVSGLEARLTDPSTGTETEQPVTVIIGLSEGDVDRTLSRTILIETMIGVGAVLVAVMFTSWGVQRSLRNLYKVTGTAREVTAELSPEGAGLDRRVPVVEEGTEIGQLAYSVNTLLSAVETQFAARVESERRMRQFLADASHELRTPLTSIRGFAELARMQRAVGESSEDNLDRIESEGTRMSRLVEDLLILARGDDVDHAPPVRDPVDVPTMVDDAVAGARAAFGEREIDLQTLPVPMVRGDRDQLLRVVRNLVTNACVHTAPERPILVRVFPEEHTVVVQVIDGGPGLPPEEAAHVFERFWRADKARTRARGGSGLGMSIVATLVRAHGGSVVFDSTVETGSTVTLRLSAAYDVVLDASGE